MSVTALLQHRPAVITHAISKRVERKQERELKRAIRAFIDGR